MGTRTMGRIREHGSSAHPGPAKGDGGEGKIPVEIRWLGHWPKSKCVCVVSDRGSEDRMLQAGTGRIAWIILSMTGLGRWDGLDGFAAGIDREADGLAGWLAGWRAGWRQVEGGGVSARVMRIRLWT
jgi:hypothetical protein